MDFQTELLADQDSLRVTLQRLVRVRWTMLVIVLMGIVVLPPLIGIDLPRAPLLVIVGTAAVWNLITDIGQRRDPTDIGGPGYVVSQLCFDLVVITALLFLSGGATNPLIFMLLPPVAVAALTLRSSLVAVIAVVAVVAYSFLTINFVPMHLNDPQRATALHLSGMWATFVASVVIISWLIVRMSQALRQRESELATIREQSLRDERVMALGTLAANAAHQLGTPLATIDLLAGELQATLKHSFDNPDALADDLSLMREQIAYCKRTLTSLTEHAGAARGVGIRRVTASVWLSALFSEWYKRRGHPSATLSGVDELNGKFAIDAKAMPEIAVDTALAHGLENLLDNAVRAGPPVRMNFEFTGAEILISVLDSGPGFATDIQNRAGKQPLAAHIHGSGVGLLLTRAAVERLGGRLELGNRADGGAVARVWIPAVKIAA